MIASAWAIWATRRLCSWMFSGYVLCMSPQRRMNFMRDRYAKKWLVAMDPAGRRSDPQLRVQGVAEAQTDDGVDRHRQQDERKRELDVRDAHEHRRRPALDESGDEAEQAAEDRGEDHRAHADEERQPRAVQDAREEIAAELIGAEEVAGGAGRAEALREIGAERIVRRQPRRRQRRDDRRHREPHPEPLFH